MKDHDIISTLITESETQANSGEINTGRALEYAIFQ